jgi:hypothetical protein
MFVFLDNSSDVFVQFVSLRLVDDIGSIFNIKEGLDVNLGICIGYYLLIFSEGLEFWIIDCT